MQQTFVADVERSQYNNITKSAKSLQLGAIQFNTF